MSGAPKHLHIMFPSLESWNEVRNALEKLEGSQECSEKNWIEVRKVLEAQTHLPCVKGFPLQNLLPSLLIILIVNFNNIRHVLLSDILFLPLPPRKETGGEMGPTHNESVPRYSEDSLLNIIYP